MNKNPIKCCTEFDLSHKEISQNAPKTIEPIKSILEGHKDEKGIIHTVSTTCKDYLMDNLKDDRLIEHNSKNRIEQLEEFKKSERPMVLISPSMNEGVDLPGSRLIGTLIVGVGLPGLSAERNIIRDYFENRAECGYDYSYTYPGMNSVLQAAGRVIRRPEDRGVVILIDDRYAGEKYRALYPPHWQGMRFAADIPALQAELAEFWAKDVSE